MYVGTGKAVGVTIALLLLGSLVAGFLIGLLGQDAPIWFLPLCTCAVGALAFDGAIKAAPKANHRRAAMIVSVLLATIMVMSVRSHWLEFERVPWGSVLTTGPMLFGIFGTLVRRTLETADDLAGQS